MSKKSRQRKWRRVEAQRRKEQVALQQDTLAGEHTIGDLASRFYMHKTSDSVLSPQSEIVTISALPSPQSTLPEVSEPWKEGWPPCPKSCDSSEWRRALENRDHYIGEAAADGNVRPWFQYPKYSYQYSEFVYITPEMAEELLRHNPLNRRIKTTHVEGLRRDIINHRWLQTHESIAVNKLGNMHDGQHRALAIVKADTGWPIYITWNVPPEGIYATDSGDKRPVNEKLGFLFPNLKMTNKTAALCRSMMWGLSNRGIRYTESEIASFMFKHQKIVNWTLGNTRAYRSDLQAVVGKAILWWGEEIIGPFVERMRTVQFSGDGDPAKSLYLWLQNARQQGRRTAYVSPVIYYKKALAAVHAHAAKRDAKRIIAKEEDIFEWLPGWEVPIDAPCKGKVFIHPDEEATT